VFSWVSDFVPSNANCNGACRSGVRGWFRGGWDLGIEYQSYQYTLDTAILSFLLAAATAGTFLASRRIGSLPLNLAANFLLFAWASTFAFPYLGELP
jgi:hypothetical protein